MKPLKKQKIVMALLSLMLICSDITFKPVYADPDDTPGTGDVTDNPDGGNENTPANPDEGNGDATDNPDGGNQETPANPDGGNTDTPENPGGENGDATDEPDEPVYIPSSVNTLANLEITGFELSPEFSSSVNEYSLTIDASHKKVEIVASKNDYKSSVSGTGEFDVSWEQGAYDFKIVCTSESGISNSYVIHLTVSSDPYVFAPLGGETLGFVIKGLDDLTNIPEGFEKKMGSYGGKEVTVFDNDSFPFSLVYLEKENKKQDWYCYQDGLVTGAFRKLVINKTVYYYAGVADSEKKQDGYTYKDITVTGEQLNGWQVKEDNSKVMIYLYDTMGNPDYYIYDTDDGTMQRRREFEVTETKENRSFLKSPVTIAFIIVIVIAAVFAITFLKEGKKNKKRIEKNKKKEETIEFDETKFDHTVELVKTSKIKIYADPVQPNEPINLEIEKTKEFKLDDLKEDKEEVDSLIEQFAFAKEEMESLETEVEEEIETFETEIENEGESSETDKVDEEKETEILETEKEDIETSEEEKEETTEEETSKEVIVEPKKKEKKRFFFRKKKEKVVEETNEVELQPKEEKKEELPEISEVEELDAINEIQNYIDHLFYLDEKEA